MGESMGTKANIIIAGVAISVAAYLILSFFTSTGIFEKIGYVSHSEIDMCRGDIQMGRCYSYRHYW